MEDHTKRRDRQYWREVQELCFECVQVCLREIYKKELIVLRPPNALVLGTMTYLELIWHYIEIFLSPAATLNGELRGVCIVCLH